MEVDHNDANNSFGRSETRADDGSLFTTGARTAARSSADEIAVNAQFIDGPTEYSFNQYDASSTTGYQITAQSLFPDAHDATLDFFLPPTLLEIQTNLEVGPSIPPITASVSAQLTVFLPTSGFEFFNFSATLEAGYVAGSPGGPLYDFDYDLTSYAVVGFDTVLDLSPLDNPIVTVVGDGEFATTVTVEFPSFAGQLQLGPVAPGEELEVTYYMTAEVNGVASYTSAIAAINDPFFLSTDPVVVSPIAVVADAGVMSGNVPEPTSLALLCGGLAALAGCTRAARRA